MTDKIDSNENEDAHVADGSGGHDVIQFDPAKRAAKRGRPRKAESDTGGSSDANKAKDPKTIVLAHRIAAALAGVTPTISTGVEPMPKPDVRFAQVVDERGAVLPIAINEHDEIKEVVIESIEKAASDYLRRQDVLDIIDRETDGLGLLIRDFRPKFIAEIANIWKTYALYINIESIRMIKQKSEPGLAIRALSYDFIDHVFDDTPWFDELLSRLTPAERTSLMAFVGSFFFDDADRSQYAYLHGEGENTKGRFVKALIHLLGKAANAATELRFKDGPFWAHANLYLKRVVAFTELGDPNLVVSASFKGYTGDDYTLIEPKGVNAFKAKICAKFIIASNKEPYVSKDKADMRRALYFKPEQFCGESLNDATLEFMWDAQGPGFFAKCVEEYMRQCPNHERIIGDQDRIMELAEQNESPATELIDSYLVVDDALGFKMGDLKKLLKNEGLLSSTESARGFLRVFTRHTGVKIGGGEKQRVLAKGQAQGKPVTAYWGFGIKKNAFKDGNLEPLVRANSKDRYAELSKLLGFYDDNY